LMGLIHLCVGYQGGLFRKESFRALQRSGI